MKTAALIARILLGLAFVVFGLMYWINVVKQPPPPPAGGAFIGAMVPSGYFGLVKGLEVLGGFLVLSKRFMPLGLVILGPILVNILCYTIFLDHSPISVIAVLGALHLFLLWSNRSLFGPLFGPPQSA